MFNKLIKLAKAACTIDIDFNPRVVQFVMHYVKGSQSEMTLNEREQLATRYQLLMTMYEEEDISLVGENGFSVDIATDEGLDLFARHPAQAYLNSVVMGLVGGFDYKLDGLVAKCVDVWDFNAGFDLSLSIDIPKGIYGMFKKISRHLRLEWTVEETEKAYKVSIVEGDLTRLNSTHAFTTRWEIDFTGESCSIDREQYEEDLETLRKKVMAM